MSVTGVTTVGGMAWVGAPRLLKVLWTDPQTGLVVTPPTTCLLRGPSGEQVLAVSGPDVDGYFSATATPDVKGRWKYGFSSTGAFAGYAEGEFYAEPRGT